MIAAVGGSGTSTASAPVAKAVGRKPASSSSLVPASYSSRVNPVTHTLEPLAGRSPPASYVSLAA